MSRTMANHLFQFLLSLAVFSSAVAGEKSHVFSRTISPASHAPPRQESLTHLHFYFHDVVSGPNQTAFEVARVNNTANGFGSVMIFDDPLTSGPEWGSDLVGRAQGVYADASREDLSLLMVLNLAFVRGEYNGSNLSVLGRNSVASGVREFPIVGGSGVFRFARGYAQAKTHSLTAEEVVVEYDVFVYH